MGNQNFDPFGVDISESVAIKLGTFYRVHETNPIPSTWKIGQRNSAGPVVYFVAIFHVQLC